MKNVSVFETFNYFLIIIRKYIDEYLIILEKINIIPMIFDFQEIFYSDYKIVNFILVAWVFDVKYYEEK